MDSTPKPEQLNEGELREKLWEIMGERNKKILAAQKTDALVLPYFEADNEAADQILDLIRKDRSALLEQIEAELPKDKPTAAPRGQVMPFNESCINDGFNAALSEVRTILQAHKGEK